MLSEGSSVKGSPEDKQPSGPCIKGSAKISWRVTLAHYTGQCPSISLIYHTVQILEIYKHQENWLLLPSAT